MYNINYKFIKILMIKYNVSTYWMDSRMNVLFFVF